MHNDFSLRCVYIDLDACCIFSGYILQVRNREIPWIIHLDAGIIAKFDGFLDSGCNPVYGSTEAYIRHLQMRYIPIPSTLSLTLNQFSTPWMRIFVQSLSAVNFQPIFN